MARLWAAIKRIWTSVHNITKEVAKKAAWGTGTALGSIGITIAAVAAVLLLAGILVIILIVSIPWGMFGRTDHASNQTVAPQPS